MIRCRSCNEPWPGTLFFQGKAVFKCLKCQTVNVRTRETFEQFVPLLAVDIIEAVEAEGWDTAFATTGVGSFGVGVQTFGGDERDVAQPQRLR